MILLAYFSPFPRQFACFVETILPNCQSKLSKRSVCIAKVIAKILTIKLQKPAKKRKKTALLTLGSKKPKNI
ncbi:MAG: hypothetical protein IKL48_03460 [Elusimicrobiaceae bacterium]|nr:hypothetical protein [Elusimicrobiaceae bacterium]